MTRTSSLKESFSASLPLSCLNQREITNRDLFFSVLLTLKDWLEFVSRVQVLGVIVSMERIFKFGVLYMGKGLFLDLFLGELVPYSLLQITHTPHGS